MTAWASVLIPAGSAIFGAVVAGSAAFGSQIFTQRRTYARERESREHAFTVRRYEIERDTLLQLQTAISELYATYENFERREYLKKLPKVAPWGTRKLIHRRATRSTGGIHSVDLYLQYIEQVQNVETLNSRIIDEPSREQTRRYIHAMKKAYKLARQKKPGLEFDFNADAKEAFAQAQKVIGGAIRRDPFEGVR
jgi:hypothetical protein